MVARTPPKQQRRMVVVAPHLSPTLLRETVKKVDKCMARLQELQYTVSAAGSGTKVISSAAVNLSPPSRSNRCCKQESSFLSSSLRIRNANTRNKSPLGKLPALRTEDWRSMSLPAMLLGETMGEVLQATRFARNIVQAAAVSRKPAMTDDDPKTPIITHSSSSTNPKTTNSGVLMQARRRREKQVVIRTRTAAAAESDMMPSLTRAKSKINFNRECCDKENCSMMYMANRFSPRNRPWARKTVLFPNPLFHSSSSPTSHHQKFFKTKSPVIVRNRHSTPHKFLIKSPPPPPDSSKFQVKIKSPPPIYISPNKKSPKASSSSSSSSSAAAAKMMRIRPFSPSRLAKRLVSSPLKSRKSSVVVQRKNEEMTKFTDIARNRQQTAAAYKFVIKSSSSSSPQGKMIKSSLVSTSPTYSLGKKSSTPKLRRSFSPSSRLAKIVGY